MARIKPIKQETLEQKQLQKRFQLYSGINIREMQKKGFNPFYDFPRSFSTILLANTPKSFSKKIDVLKDFNFFKGSMLSNDTYLMIDSQLDNPKGQFVKSMKAIQRMALRYGASVEQANKLVHTFSTIADRTDDDLRSMEKQVINSMKQCRRLGVNYTTMANRGKDIMFATTPAKIREIYNALAETVFGNLKPSTVDKVALVKMMESCSTLMTNSSTEKIKSIYHTLYYGVKPLKNYGAIVDLRKVCTRCPSIFASSNISTDIKEILEILRGEGTFAKKYRINLSPKVIKSLLEQDASILTIPCETFKKNIKTIYSCLKPLFTEEVNGKNVVNTTEIYSIINNLFISKNRSFLHNMKATYLQKNDHLLKQHLGDNILFIYRNRPSLLTVKPSVLNEVLNMIENTPIANELKEVLVSADINLSRPATTRKFIYGNRTAKAKRIEDVINKVKKGAFVRENTDFTALGSALSQVTDVKSMLTNTDKVAATLMFTVVNEIYQINNIVKDTNGTEKEVVDRVTCTIDLLREAINAIHEEINSKYELIREDLSIYHDIMQTGSYVHERLVKNRSNIEDVTVIEKIKELLGDDINLDDVDKVIREVQVVQTQCVTEHNALVDKLIDEEHNIANLGVMAQSIANVVELYGNQFNTIDLEAIVNNHPEAKGMLINNTPAARRQVIEKFGSDTDKMLLKIESLLDDSLVCAQLCESITIYPHSQFAETQNEAYGEDLTDNFDEYIKK